MDMCDMTRGTATYLSPRQLMWYSFMTHGGKVCSASCSASRIECALQVVISQHACGVCVSCRASLQCGCVAVCVAVHVAVCIAQCELQCMQSWLQCVTGKMKQNLFINWSFLCYIFQFFSIFSTCSAF